MKSAIHFYPDLTSVSFSTEPNVLIVRFWKKTHEQIFEFLNSNRHLVEHYDVVIFSVDHTLDAGSTEAVLRHMKKEQPWLVSKVMLITVEGSSDEKNWTRLLNAPIWFLKQEGIADGIYTSISFEVQTSKKIAPYLTGSSTLGRKPIPAVSYRQESDWIWTHRRDITKQPVREPEEILDENVSKCLTATRSRLMSEECSEADLNTLQEICRNTLMSWPISMLYQFNGFDPRCNRVGGQEDTHMFLRIIGSNWGDYTPLVGAPPIILPYADPRLQAETAEEKSVQQAKFSNERVAISWAINDVVRMMKDDNFETPNPDEFILI